MSSISGDSFINFPSSLDGLVNLNADTLTIGGVSITGNYLNSTSNTTNVNTNITLSNNGVFTVKDLSGNELLKCDNNTSITTFFNPRSNFTPSVANDLVTLSYLAGAYWQLSGSNNINGVFQTSGGGSIWFQNSAGITYVLMTGNGVQIRNALLTGDTNLFTIYNTLGGSNQLLQCDASGNLTNCPNLSYTYGDPYASIITTMASNIGGQQQTIRFVRDFTVNGLYGWKLSSTTINKMPLDTDLPITINNLYSSAMYPTTLFINGVNTVTEIASNKIKCSSGTLLNLTNNTIDFKIDSDKFKFFDILDIRAFIAIPLRIQYNVLSGYAHSFSVNNTQLFSLSSVASIPTITSNGFFTLTDNVNNQVYTDSNGIYTKSVGNAYSLMSGNGTVFLVSSSNSVLNLSNTGQTTLSASNGGLLNLNAGASLYSKTNFVCSLGVNNNNIISVYDDQGGNDTLFFSRNINDPNILFGTDITQNSVIGQASQAGAFSSDSTTSDLIIRNNQKNIRLGTDGSGLSNFIINSNGSSSFVSRSFNTHQVIIRGQEFYQNGFADSGISLNMGVNRTGNKQLWMMDPDLALNDTNTCLRFMPGNASIDVISTNGNFFRGLQVAGSTFTTNNTTTIKGTNSNDRTNSLIINNIQAGILLNPTGTGSRQYNIWCSYNGEAYGGGAWTLFDNSIYAFRLLINSSGQLILPAYGSGTLQSSASGVITSVSDSRFKDNIIYISDTKKGLEQILALKPCQFNLKVDTPTDIMLGLIAQDVEQIIPYAIDGKKYHYRARKDINNKLIYDENGDVELEKDNNGDPVMRPRTLSDMAIISTQVLAIQELYKLLQNQQNVIDNQQKEIANYKDKVNHLEITQESLLKQLITITNQINKITEKIILSN